MLATGSILVGDNWNIRQTSFTELIRYEYKQKIRLQRLRS